MAGKYDVTNVVASFLRGEYEERAELVRELGAAARMPGREMHLLVKQVVEECLAQPLCTPETTVRIGVMYGMVIGTLLEKDRADRKRLM
jgi:hypothetical protein